ncbi:MULTISPECIES: serine hydrolase [unclassified Sphingomonas]|uniref:serine hydrolase n=1 Tax=unclassified Sphingomonas TaxID=196159 RepID=UPI000289E520|nr:MULTISPECIES: serine hydrolase [unclassified Sphingomonas]
MKPAATLLLVSALCACGYGARLQGARGAQTQAPLVVAIPPRSGPAPVGHRVLPQPPMLTATITQLVRSFNGKVGVAVRSVDDGWMINAGGSQRLPQQSVSKLWVAMTVLAARDAGKLRLDDPITLTRDDITLFHQPIAGLIRGDTGYRTTVGELLQRALTMSDNTANDRLLRLVGGPTAVRGFIARKGLGAIGFGPGERMLQATTAGLTWQPSYAFNDGFNRARNALTRAERLAAFNRYVAAPLDGAAPAAIATALARLKRGEILSAPSTSYLIGTMQSSHTGKMRLRGAVPPGWTFGHKTGTGQDYAGRTAGYNDVGLLIAPDGRTYAIAVMIGDTLRPIPARQQLMQAVVSSVVATHASTVSADTNRRSASRPNG